MPAISQNGPTKLVVWILLWPVYISSTSFFLNWEHDFAEWPFCQTNKMNKNLQHAAQDSALFTCCLHFVYILIFWELTIKRLKSSFLWHNNFSPQNILHIANCPKLNMIEKNRATDNAGKFHSFFMCRIWIYSQDDIS